MSNFLKLMVYLLKCVLKFVMKIINNKFFLFRIKYIVI